MVILLTKTNIDTDKSQFHKGDLVVFKDSFNDHLDNIFQTVHKLTVKRFIYKVVSGCYKNQLLKVQSHIHPFATTTLYTKDLELFCNQVPEVADVGVHEVCNSCPRQISCLTHVMKKLM